MINAARSVSSQQSFGQRPAASSKTDWGLSEEASAAGEGSPLEKLTTVTGRAAIASSRAEKAAIIFFINVSQPCFMRFPGERIEILLDNSAGLSYNNICT